MNYRDQVASQQNQQTPGSAPAPASELTCRHNDVLALLGALVDTHSRLARLADRLFGPVPQAINSAQPGGGIQLPEKLTQEPPQMIALERSIGLAQAQVEALSRVAVRLEGL